MNIVSDNIEEVGNCLLNEGVIAYPTESCFGLGSLVDSRESVERILELKKRPWQKGLIIIAANLEQLTPWIDVKLDEYNQLVAKWPGAHTWIVNKSASVPENVCGNHQKIAVRIPDHANARKLCEYVGQAIVSTSCNPATLNPATTTQEVLNYFDAQLDAVLDLPIGNYQQPSVIQDFQSKQYIRK